MPINILITGGAGQVGLELQRLQWPTGVTLLAPASDALDLRCASSVADFFERNQIDAICNPAAFTSVDQAEDQVADAFAINALGPALLADQARKRDLPLLQVSTDYVFDGHKAGPYTENDRCNPLSIYGASKLAGEMAVIRGNPKTVVLRTAWVISANRSNFMKTMLRVAETNPTLRIVSDQVGCPTGAKDIAEAVQAIILKMIEAVEAPTGLYHFVNRGEGSWFDLAEEIFDCAAGLGRHRPELVPIASADFPTKAKRPSNSRLSTAKIARDYGIEPRDWREMVRETVTAYLTDKPQLGAAT